jgi:GNAT superfamily N-acetyltransferase
MLAALDVDVSPPGWREACAAELRNRLADGGAVAFVVDRGRAEPGRLVASGIGLIHRGLPGPTSRDPRSAYVLSVCTDEPFRGRGYATAIMTALLDWFKTDGITRVDLHASQFGIEIYRKLGFCEPKYPELTWRLPATP